MPPPTPSPQTIRFGQFLTDLRAGELHKNGTKLKLQEQPFRTLALLLERAGEVVTREEMRQALWPDNTYVDFDHGINMAIAKIREALEDCSEKPQFIETVGRRGYRFIAAIEPLSEDIAPSSSALRATPYLPPAQRHSVGREKERAELASAFASAACGCGVMVCVAGEPGIGKTTLVQDFLSGLQVSGKSFDLAMGRCSQRLAGEEAYLPFLEAVDSLLRYDGALANKLRESAPSWYAQLFPLSDKNPSDLLLQEYVRGATQERVKRELTAFVCEITRQNPLVLFFDDVHWTDPSTVDLVSHLATRLGTTKILVIVTYRPSELLLLKHPFLAVKRDLSGRSLCREIEVEFLSATDVERYIALEFLGNCFPHEFAGLIHSRTEGNPLFMVDLLRYLRDRKVIVKQGDGCWHLARSLPDLSRDIPQSVNSVIERKIGQLSDRDREVLTTAAVEGYECDSATVARALVAENIEIEEILDRLERVHAFVRRVGEDELPSGASTVRYRFVHVLYQNALYSSLTPARRIALSAALARALEGFYGTRTSAIASQLAFLYETAREPGRASDFLLIAAQNAQAIFANQEAIALARRGLALLAKMPETPERDRKELGLQVTLAFGFMCTLGYAAPETGANMDRARKLCQDSLDHASLCPVLWGLWAYYLCKGDMKSARTTAEQVLNIARALNDPILLLGSHVGMAMSRLHQGELVASRKHYEEVVKLYDVSQHARYVQLYRFDPAIHSAGQMVRLLWLLGYPDQACRKAEESLALASGLSSPLSLAFIQLLSAQLYQNLRLPAKTRELAEACIALCEEQAIQLERAWAECWYGWAVAELGETDRGLLHIRSALDTQLSIGARVAYGYCQAVLAEALWHAGRTEEGLHAVEDGLHGSKQNGEPFYDADLWRLKGELLRSQNKIPEAEGCLQTGIKVARQQAAKSLELRAATSLARLWQKHGKRNEAHQLMAGTYSWFTEGFDTADLRESALLLAELS